MCTNVFKKKFPENYIFRFLLALIYKIINLSLLSKMFMAFKFEKHAIILITTIMPIDKIPEDTPYNG